MVCNDDGAISALLLTDNNLVGMHFVQVKEGPQVIMYNCRRFPKINSQFYKFGSIGCVIQQPYRHNRKRDIR